MLRKLRQKDIKKIMWALVIVIVPAFALWGISSVMQSRSRYIGTIGKHKISVSTFRNYEKYFQMLMFFTAGSDFLRKVSNQELMTLTWQQILLTQAAKKENLKASDEELWEKLRSLALLNHQGHFNQQFYLSRLRAAGIVPSQFESFLKDTIAVEKLIKKVRSAVKVTDKEVFKLYREENEKAKISYLLIDYNKIAQTLNPQEKELRAYFQKHKDNFRVPPKVKINYIILPNSQLASLYKFIRKSRKYSLEQIAKAFALKIESSDYFSLSEPIKNLGWVKKINEAAFSLTDNQTSKPLALAADKVVIIKRVGRQEAYLPTFKGSEAKVKKAYLENISHQQAEEIARELIKIAKQEKAGTLEKLLKHLPTKQQKFITLKTSPYFGHYSYLEDIGLNKDLLEAIFHTRRGEIIKRYFSLSRGIFIVKVEDFVSVDKKKFSQDKEKYRQRLLNFKQKLALQDYLANLYKNSRFFVSTLP